MCIIYRDNCREKKVTLQGCNDRFSKYDSLVYDNVNKEIDRDAKKKIEEDNRVYRNVDKE